MNRTPLIKANHTSSVRNGAPAPIEKRPLGILIHTDGVELDETLRDAVLCKIGRVRQYAPRALAARVRLVKDGASNCSHRYRAHVLFEVRGNDISAEHRADDPITALDCVSKKLERRLRKRKTAVLARRVRAQRRGLRQNKH